MIALVLALTLQCASSPSCSVKLCAEHAKEHLTASCVSGGPCAAKDYDYSEIDEFCGRRNKAGRT